MSFQFKRRVRFLVRSERGQALPWMVLLTVLFLGMAGLTIDLGHAYVCYRELQASTDAAALAGAQELSASTATSTSVTAAVNAYSSKSGAANANPNLPNPTVATTLLCLTTLTNEGILCSSSPTGNNALKVVQSVTVPTYFIRALSVFGMKSATSITMTSTATAAMLGAQNAQYNVAIVMDTTASMNTNDSDASCGHTRIYCALQGMQTLLQSLSPCTADSTAKNCTPYDQVSLFTFPNVQASTASKDTTCSSGNPTILNYTTPTKGATWTPTNFSSSAATYQITNYVSDYSATNQAGGGLSTTSTLGIASGASSKSNCAGLEAPGGKGTYYAGAVYAAQSSLMAAQIANPGSQNALIVLSDGDASSSDFATAKSNGAPYPSTVDQCTQGIAAANFATSQGTTVYTIAYGAASSGCSTDKGSYAVSPCSALQQMATAPANFYSDATAAQNKGQCVSSANPNLSLNAIFKRISTQFTVSRLIPNGTT